MTHTIWLLITYLACFNTLQAMESTQNDNVILKQKVSQAIIKFEQTHRKNWAYQIERYENEEGDISRSIERHSPFTTKKPWSLIRINGKTPTEKQKRKFIDKKTEQEKKSKSGSNYAIKLREIINQESLKLISENSTHVKMSFNVYLSKMGKDSIGKLKGSLYYNRKQEFIDKINIVNTSEFSPIFSANITDLSLTLSFIHINNNILPLQQDMKLKGTFAYFTEINEVSTDTYSNYNYQVD